MYKSTPLSTLRLGAKLGSPVKDQQGRLLLGTGVEITQELLDKLQQRGLRDVIVAKEDWLRLTAFESKGKVKKALPNRAPVKSEVQTRASSELDRSISGLQDCEVVASNSGFAEPSESCGAEGYDLNKMDRIFDHHQKTVHLLGDLFGQISSGGAIPAEMLRNVAQETVMQTAIDLDLLTCMGINPVGDETVFAHATNVATLAVAIGVRLGLSEKSLCELGMGCLIHDAGMLNIDETLYQSKEVLDPVAFLGITKHPIIAADLLYEKMEHVPVGVRMVVYQMHERCNGSGYPRGRTADRIHPLAKISAVADAYVALVSPRPHRHAMLPYFAMKKILEDVKAGLFDATVVRALLHTVSLFPIGSYCELNNGGVAKVIRSNGSAYDRPIVEAWQHSRSSAESKVIDLAEEDLKVVKPLTSRR
ncbi:MAG: HD domain-containing protein [Pirellulales bacterium]|nr:HD domain-containing protein [Pirellulales bacterium]